MDDFERDDRRPAHPVAVLLMWWAVVVMLLGALEIAAWVDGAVRWVWGG